MKSQKRRRRELNGKLSSLVSNNYQLSRYSSESESSDSQRSSTGKDFEILDAEEDEDEE